MDSPDDPSSRLASRLGWALLLVGLPLAAFGAFLPANEYRSTLGIDALDCDGPWTVYLLAVPALLLYGTGLAVNLRRWRLPLNLAAALLCLAICVALAVNLARAVAEQADQAEACAAR